tara:strand:- start:572 stop:697 length:126 start_codon:yes stop_codon:yes gene_type:complete
MKNVKIKEELLKKLEVDKKINAFAVDLIRSGRKNTEESKMD